MKHINLLLIAMALSLSACATLDPGQTTVSNEARKSQAESLGALLTLVNNGTIRLHDEMIVAPADPKLPMQNVSVSVRRAADPATAQALFALADMSRYKDPAGVADVFIALIGGAKEVAIAGLDKLPWYWGFDAFKTALSNRGYSISAGDGASVVVSSSGVDATRAGRDLNIGSASGSDRDHTKTEMIPMEY